MILVPLLFLKQFNSFSEHKNWEITSTNNLKSKLILETFHSPQHNRQPRPIQYPDFIFNLRILRHKTHPTLRYHRLPYIPFRIKYPHFSRHNLRRVGDGMGCQADQFLHLTDVASASRKLAEIGLVLWLCFGEACCSPFVGKVLQIAVQWNG
jgi:hypothetical protein